MALQGNIDSFSVADVLRLLGSSAKSGRLIVNGDRGTGSLWLHDGLVVGGGTTRVVAAGGPDEIAAVTFDLMRFVAGSFIFEAGIDCPDPQAAVPVEPLLAEVDLAMTEWGEITAVVPSIETTVALAARLQQGEVSFDQRLWDGVWAAGAGGSTTVEQIAARLDLTELPALRLVRDLVQLGVLELTAEVLAAPLHSSFEPQSQPADEPPFQPADETVFQPADETVFQPAESASDAPYAASPMTFQSERPMAFISDLAEPALSAPFAGPASAPPSLDAPAGPANDPTDPRQFDDIFGEYDPFGAAAAGSDDLFATPAPTAEPDDLARQMALLSPGAAAAVASADAAGSSDEEERARVAKFLGSV